MLGPGLGLNPYLNPYMSGLGLHHPNLNLG